MKRMTKIETYNVIAVLCRCNSMFLPVEVSVTVSVFVPGLLVALYSVHVAWKIHEKIMLSFLNSGHFRIWIMEKKTVIELLSRWAGVWGYKILFTSRHPPVSCPPLTVPGELCCHGQAVLWGGSRSIQLQQQLLTVCRLSSTKLDVYIKICVK